jgi:hypothetical protein
MAYQQVEGIGAPVQGARPFGCGQRRRRAKEFTARNFASAQRGEVFGAHLAVDHAEVVGQEKRIEVAKAIFEALLRRENIDSP